MRANIEIIFHEYGGYWGPPVEYHKKEAFKVSKGEKINGIFFSNSFSIAEINEDSVKIISEIAIAKNNDNGTINLRDTRKEIVLALNKEEDLKPSIMDSSCYWTVKLISIEK